MNVCYFCNVKKIFSILFTFIYLTSTAGVFVQLHYCHDFVSDVNFGYSAEASCVCDAKADKQCCADDFKYIKLDENHVLKNIVVNFSTESFNLISIDFKEILINSNFKKQLFAQFEQPPPSNISKQILLSVFII